MAEAQGHGPAGGGAPGAGGAGGAHGGGHKHKCHCDHHEGHHEEGVPEWMVSFADNVCLMMGFFVIMLAMNMKPAQGGSGDGPQDGSTAQAPPAALLDAAIAIREGFNNPVNPLSADPQDQPLIRRLKELKEGRGRATQPGTTGPKDAVTSVRPSDFYSVGGVVPFADGAGELSAAGDRTAQEIADKLRGPRFMIEVRGHVSAAEANQSVEQAISLSHRRAMSVARALAAYGIPWTQLRVVACGDQDRVTPIAYELAAHRTNQRVEVIVTKETVADDPYLRDAFSPADTGAPVSGATEAGH